MRDDTAMSEPQDILEGQSPRPPAGPRLSSAGCAGMDGREVNPGIWNAEVWVADIFRSKIG